MRDSIANTLWTFGDSFTAEYGEVEEKYSKYTKYKKLRGGSFPKVWPTILADKLSCKVQNKGIGATGNQSIFFRFCEEVKNLKKGDTVIVGWAETTRFILAKEWDSPEKVIERSTPFQDIATNTFYDTYDNKVLDYIRVNRMSLSWWKEVYYYNEIISEVCKEKGVKFVNWSFTPTFAETFKSVYRNNKQWLPLDQSDFEQIWQETNNKVKDVHLSEEGHKKQAKVMYDHCKILTGINNL